MFRPRINKDTLEVELVDIERDNFDEKDLIRIEKESNERNITVNGEDVKTQIEGDDGVSKERKESLAKSQAEEEEKIKKHERKKKEEVTVNGEDVKTQIEGDDGVSKDTI